MILKLFLLVLTLSSVYSTSIRGFSPKDLKLINSENQLFSCKDLTKTIPLSHVNDNYCDCSDGSDEPGTPACINGKFYCQNNGHVPQEIFSSRVWDGVCDCCDGSDEETFSTCPNSCQELAAKAAKEQAELIKKHTEGVKKKQQYKETAERELNEHKHKLKSLEDKLQQLNIEKEEQQERKRVVLQQKLDESKQLEEKEVQEEIAESDEDYSSDYVEEVEEAVEEEEEEEEQEDVTSTFRFIFDVALNLINSALPFVSTNEKYVAKEDTQLREIERQIRDLEREIEDLRNVLQGDYGENNVFFHLRGKCFRAESAEYSYELCPFDKVTQHPKKSGSSTSLGKWDFNKQEKWKPEYKYMVYKDGQRCWGGPDRSTTVEVLCGTEDEVTEPQEPSKCAYSMKLYTPAACDEKFSKSLPVPEHGHRSDDIL